LALDLDVDFEAFALLTFFDLLDLIAFGEDDLAAVEQGSPSRLNITHPFFSAGGVFLASSISSYRITFFSCQVNTALLRFR